MEAADSRRENENTQLPMSEAHIESAELGGVHHRASNPGGKYNTKVNAFVAVKAGNTGKRF